MSIIPCTGDCVYQKDGCCSLERTASYGAGLNQAPFYGVQSIGLQTGFPRQTALRQDQPLGAEQASLSKKPNGETCGHYIKRRT
jgi:hypothetical protein